MHNYSPLLFIIHIHLVIREVNTTHEYHKYILAYIYADDIAQNYFHLQLKQVKTEVMIMVRSHQILRIKIGDHALNQLQCFKYLGSRPVNEQSNTRRRDQ